MIDICDIPEERLINEHQLYAIVERNMEDMINKKAYSRENILDMFRQLKRKDKK